MRSRVRITVRSLALAAALAAPALAPAQIAPAPADTLTAEEGTHAGRLAARQPTVAGRALAGFVGGLPVGFFGLIALRDPSPEPKAFAGAGLAAIVAAASVGSVAPGDSLASAAASYGPVYQRAFTEAYGRRLGSRRRAAATAGGLLGAGVGLATLIAFLSGMST